MQLIDYLVGEIRGNADGNCGDQGRRQGHVKTSKKGAGSSLIVMNGRGFMSVRDWVTRNSVCGDIRLCEGRESVFLSASLANHSLFGRYIVFRTSPVGLVRRLTGGRDLFPWLPLGILAM